ncbi:hypothetical protein D3C80_1594710 [compost metagenome]
MVLTAMPWLIAYAEVRLTLVGGGTTVIGITLIGRSSRRAPVSMWANLLGLNSSAVIS